ncbi:phosphoadenosine phosphosulfate reductase [Schleiferilactobacillus shenzhenensis LY-73]|uniref:Phosphoadenosine phosphosulfate reductase n=2 Tax=Schleiferilactobacillus shenzhenensis TaxID=1231337 RepID=U4TKG3_9LACO|nr:phosphoadenosine phosphosulfate reductase [Schleiferilactobacillus shenzhenensis LY-73]
MYLVPGLEFQEMALRWYEKQYGNKIIRLPHFETSDFYRYGSFRDPDGEVKIVSVREEYDYLRYKTGTYWIAGGERISDSIVRRAMIKHSGSIDEQRGRFYPLAEWTKQDVMQYIDHYHLFLSPEQKRLGFSFASLAGSELSVIRQYYPADYERILHYFPEADAGVERFERYGE